MYIIKGWYAIKTNQPRNCWFLLGKEAPPTLTIREEKITSCIILMVVVVWGVVSAGLVATKSVNLNSILAFTFAIGLILKPHSHGSNSTRSVLQVWLWHKKNPRKLIINKTKKLTLYPWKPLLNSKHNLLCWSLHKLGA